MSGVSGVNDPNYNGNTVGLSWQYDNALTGPTTFEPVIATWLGTFLYQDPSVFSFVDNKKRAVESYSSTMSVSTPTAPPTSSAYGLSVSMIFVMITFLFNFLF